MIIFKQSMRRIFNSKIRVLVLLVVPVLFIAMFALQDERSLSIGIVDKDSSKLSKRLVSSLGAMDKTKLFMIDESKVYDKTATYQLDYSIVIEKGFEEKLISGKSPDIGEFYINEKDKIFFARNVVENYIKNMKLLADGAAYDKVKFEGELQNYDNGRLTVSSESDVNAKAQHTRFALGFLVQFMLYMSVITAGILIEDKSSGLFYRTFYAPVTLRRYMFENLLAFLAVGVMQVTAIFILINRVFGIDFGKNPFSLYALYIVFAFVCVSLGTLIVSLFRKPIAAYSVIFFLTTPLVMLGGSYWPSEYMPQVLQKIAQFVPTSWVMKATEMILYSGKDITGISLEICILLIFGGIFLGAGLLKKVDISK